MSKVAEIAWYGPRMARGLVLFLVLLAGCVPASSAATEPPAQTVPASPVETAPATASSAPSSSPSAVPASPGPTTSPAASFDPTALELETTSCDGGVVLDWSASMAADFHHYSALRSPERDIAPDWPPIAPAVDWGDTYTTDRFVTSGADDTVTLSERSWFYRVMAYDAENRVVGASPVRTGRMDPVVDLGAVRATAADAGRVRIAWRPYGGFSECFSSYRVTVARPGQPAAVLAVISEQSAQELVTGALHSGTTVTISIEALRTTILGSFTVAEAEPLAYEVP